MDSVSIVALLQAEGITDGDAQAQARAALEAAGLTRAGKQQIARAKLPRVRAALAAAFARHCGDPVCLQLSRAQAGDRPALRVTPAACSICSGSSHRRAARELAATLVAAGICRVLLLGGAPDSRAALVEGLASQNIAVRHIDGSGRAHTAEEARPHLHWAELLVIWSQTPLHHKVSVPYTANVPPGLPVVTVRAPGVIALCRTVVEGLARRRAA